MSNRNISHWDINEETLPILFFSDRLIEMLNHNTVDSYKVPLFNTVGLGSEILEIIEHVKNGNLLINSVKGMTEEFQRSLRVDRVSQKILGEDFSIENKLHGNTVSDEFENEIRNIMEKLSPYHNVCEDLLCQEIVDKKRKTVINELLSSWLSDCIFRHYSRSHIFYSACNYFFNPENVTRIDSNELFPSFLEFFDLQPTTFTLITIVDQKFEKMFDENLDSISFHCEIPDDLNYDTQIEIDFQEKIDMNQTFMIWKNVLAMDPYSASETVISNLQSAKGYYGFVNHSTDLFLGNESLAYGEELIQLVRPDLSPMKMMSDLEHSFHDQRLANILQSFKRLNKRSFTIIDNSLSFHREALITNRPEGQFPSLWMALETIINPTNNRGKIINAVKEVIVPVLGVKYFYKIISNIKETLPQKIGFQYYLATLNKIDCTDSDLEKVALLLSSEKYRHLLEEIIDKELGTEPLFRNRLYLLNRQFKTIAGIKKMMHDHNNRIDWHISRIYRCRNLISHCGIKNVNLPSLTDNLHWYYHTSMDTILEKIVSEPQANNLDLVTILNKISSDFKEYLEYLNNPQGNQVTDDNFQRVFHLR